MTDKKLRWGLLSTARINRAVMPPIRASARNELAAVASRTAAKAQAYAKEWDIPRAHGTYEALLADPQVDAIYIGLPNSLHCEWAVRCAEAGKHVLCEKPLAITTAEVERMTAAARANNTVLTEAFMYRHHPQTAQVRELIAQGAIGPVRTISGCFSFYNGNPADVRWAPELGGGALWDIGCYPVSYARTILAEEPVEVSGRQALTERDVDHTFAGLLRFPSGALATFDCSFLAPPRWGMEIVGDQGILRVLSPYKPEKNETIEFQRGDDTEIIASRGRDLYEGEIEDMAAAVLDGQPPLVSLEDSLANARALTSLYQSARAGQPVTL